MREILSTLFDSEAFMPHGHCYLWRTDILWLNVGSDALIAFAYYTIPFFLVYFVHRRKDLVFDWIFVMFALFILACGTTHALDIWTVWRPAYALQGIVKLFTAGVSIATALALLPLMPKALRLPSARDLEDKSRELERVNEQLRQLNASLESRVEQKARDVARNEERFRRVFEAAPNGLLMVDQGGRIVLCNAEVELLFGYDRQDLIGRQVEVLVPERLRPDHPSYRKAFFAKPETRQMGAGRDLFGLRKDGDEFPVEIGLNPLATDEGSFVLASIVDISKRKTLETKFLKAAEAVRQKNLEMEQFVYTVSHDLKSPLVTSSGFLGFLKEDFMAQRYDKILGSIQRLEVANSRMSQLIDDLLQLSRVGRLKIEPEPIDMVTLVRGVVEGLSLQLKEKGAKIIVQDGMPRIVADRKRVYQAFDNLIGNALKYACDGKDPEIVVGCDRHGSESRFFVRDDGPGIDPKYHQKIFGLFQRLESDGRGTGVGLTIVARIMQQHGGRVWVESEPQKGATFWLAFPDRIAHTEDDGDAAYHG